MLRTMTLPLCLLLACNGNAAPQTAASPQSAGSSVTDKSVVQPTAKSAGDAPAKSPTLAAGVAPHSGAVPGPIDPPWFRLDLFPGATLTSSGRTQKDAQGLFSTQMLLTLPDGTTRDKCVDTLREALAPTLPTLEQKQDPKDGRVNLTGSNADYSVTLLCGEAKGKMSAYLSYRWLRPPPSSPSPASPSPPPPPTAAAPSTPPAAP